MSMCLTKGRLATKCWQYAKYPIICGVSYMSGGCLGFFPSTVSLQHVDERVSWQVDFPNIMDSTCQYKGKKENIQFDPIWGIPPKTNMTGWKIHHEWVDVFPIETRDFPVIVMWSWTQGCIPFKKITDLLLGSFPPCRMFVFGRASLVYGTRDPESSKANLTGPSPETAIGYVKSS